MPFSPGSRHGPYEILAKLGVGGMGEVYRARDSRLKRDVAVKVLPESLSRDPERVARFQREAEILASMNHPNIAAIHGLEERDGILELVEGPTLADRIARSLIPIEETLTIARQIAEALEAAHERGIVHRDLKPDNIKVGTDGTVKVLDFGLAKAMDPGSQDAVLHPNPSSSPTMTSPAMTGRGMILGTAAYMSPEQAKGRLVDKRSDVWAFGCVLYEMLTGRRAFDGEDFGDTLASVLRAEPDWQALPAATPPSVRRLLRRCLEKDRKRRQSDIADARLEIEDALSAPAADTQALIPGRSRRGRTTVTLVGAAGLIVGGAAAGISVWMATRPNPGAVTRTTIQISGEAALRPRGLAITPDGSTVVYAATDRLVVRRLDQFEATEITGVGSPSQPFISPDGQWIGFFDGLSLKRVSIAGGRPVTVLTSTIPSGGPLGATWGTDGVIVFATSIADGLQRVRSAGGKAETLTTLDRSRREVRHVQPQVLPGGRALLFTIQYAIRAPNDTQAIGLLDLDTRTHTVLLPDAAQPRYLPSGHLLYRAEGAYHVVPFDLERRMPVGTATPIDGLRRTTQLDVAENGTLVYLAGNGVPSRFRTLVWVDRQDGRETPLGTEPRSYIHPRLSPDELRIAVHPGQGSESPNPGRIWLWDVRRRMMTPGTLDASNISIWLDSTRLVFSGFAAGGRPNLYLQSFDGTGVPATRLTESANAQHPTGLTPDGTQVVFNEMTATQQGDIRALTVAPTPQVRALVATDNDERGGVVSRAGWLAYESNRTGRYEVWVQHLSAPNSAPLQVTTAGGRQPLFSREGTELFYVAPDGRLMCVPVETKSSAWSHGALTTVFDKPYYNGADGTSVRQYDVMAGAKRFLVMKDETGESDDVSINVVLNWFGELERLVSTK